MIIKDFEQPVVIKDETSSTPPKKRMTFIFGLVDDQPYTSYGEGKNEKQARNAAEQGWEYYKNTHYGPNVHVETVRNGANLIKADKYKHGA
jgi:hypothetical protein